MGLLFQIQLGPYHCPLLWERSYTKNLLFSPPKILFALNTSVRLDECIPLPPAKIWVARRTGYSAYTAFAFLICIGWTVESGLLNNIHPCRMYDELNLDVIFISYLPQVGSDTYLSIFWCQLCMYYALTSTGRASLC